jgi:signal transduction histidine kinase/ActR/RegA family two-component response regulator
VIGRAGRVIARASLAVKIATLGGVVTALIVLGTFWALNIETRDSARRLFLEELARHQRTLLQLQRSNLTQLITSAAIITQSPTLRSALDTYRAESNFGNAVRDDLVHTVQRELSKLLGQVDHDLLVVTDNGGRVFAAAARGGPAPVRGTDLSASSAVRRALDPAAAADSGELAVFRVADVSYQSGVYPLVLNGFSIGTVLLGERLDEGLLASARAVFGGEIVVKAGSTVLASTIPDAGRDVSEALDRSDAERSARRSIRIAGTEFIGASLTLGQAQSGEDVRLWLLQPLDRTVEALGDPLRRDFILYGIIAIFLTAAGSGLAARSALTPVHRLVALMRSSAGAPETAGRAIVERTEERRAARDLPAEVRALKESFGQLMDSIAAKQQELTQRTTELATANAVLVDEIRERKRVENELLQRDEQLRQSQKLEAVGTLAGGIAHDFNNLITAVSGFTQLAMMGLDAKSPVTADLKQVMEAANRAGHLTKQLLAFSRKQVLQPTVLDVAEVVHTLAPMLSRLLGDHVKLRVEAQHDVARVVSDRGQLEQVILNLAINARDAMPTGGTLSITVANVARPNADGGSQRGVAIRVSDTGVGIPADIRERIFEPFFTTKEPGKGTGLGLSTVYGIIKQSGGCIEVDSRVGLGTTFTITLPIAPQRPDALPEDAIVPQLPRGSETILLVEDDDAVRAFTRRTLEDCGYRVLPASEPLEALRIAARTRVDVILSDMMMPNLTGAQFVERFLAKHPAPVVIFMSGYADEALVAEGRAYSEIYLRKPFTPSVLAHAVRDAINASRRAIPVAL